MSTFKYFNGQTELVGIRPIDNAEFKAIGGVPSKHNRWDSFSRMVGVANGQLLPVTRKVEYKSNPKLHKCDARCMNATGFLCECSCGGKNHGAG